jgi:hypothetical protein
MGRKTYNCSDRYNIALKNCQIKNSLAKMNKEEAVAITSLAVMTYCGDFI